MKKVFLLVVLLSLSACGGEDNKSSSKAAENGTFKATMGDTEYELVIKCFQFDSDTFDTEFTFASDDGSGMNDTDGDGIIVRGDRIKLGKDRSPIEVDGISLDIVVEGVRYSASPIIAAMEKRDTWAKTSNGVSGTDKMTRDDDNGMGGNALPITYEVVCK